MKKSHVLLLSLILTIVVLPLTLDQTAEASHPQKVTNLTGTEGDTSVTLSWDRPTSGTTPQDYIIQYRLTTTSGAWSPVSDGVSTRTTIDIENLINNISYDFKVAAKKLDNNRLRYSDPISLTPYSTTTTVNPQTDKCSQVGADHVESKCYALLGLSINERAANNYNIQEGIRGFKGQINVDDVNVSRGFVGAAYWLEFTSYRDSRNNLVTPILELGIIDYYGSRSHPKFYCAEDGVIQYQQWNANANRDYNFEILKKSTSTNGVTWGLTVNGNNCTDITVPPGSFPYILKRGTETSYNSSPNFTHEFDRMNFKLSNNNWYLLQSYFGSNYSPLIEPRYFVDPCGQNNSVENFYHIETGKGVRSNC